MSVRDEIFDEDGNIKKAVHDEDHIWVHFQKTKAEIASERREKIITALVSSLLIGAVTSLFGVLWWAFTVFVQTGGKI